MFLLSESQLLQFIIVNMLIFARITGVMLTLPVLNAAFIQPQIKVILSLLITIIISTNINMEVTNLTFNIYLFVLLINQLIFGALLGFIFQIVFQIFILTGQIIAMQAGLGFANLVEPQTHTNLPTVSHIYLLATTLIFLGLDGHLKFISYLSESFNKFPVFKTFNFVDLIQYLTNEVSWMFSSALLIALPVVISLLIVNITFGMMAKAAPQLNIFSIGFPTTLVVGLLLIFITLPYFLLPFPTLIEHVYEHFQLLIK